MKIALQNGCVLIRDATKVQSDVLRGSGLCRWSKQDAALSATAGLDFLRFLSSVCKLPSKIAAELMRLEEKARSIDAMRIDPEPASLYPYPVKAKLFLHQIRAANMAMATFGHCPGEENGAGRGGGFGLLFEMGCGKTLTALAIVGALLQARAIRRVLVVAPASVCAVWPKEFQEYAAFPASVQELSGDKRSRLAALDSLQAQPGLCVAVINYESTWREDIFNRLMDWAPDLVIADESQRIKSPAAAQSKAMHRLGDIAKYRLALSGTPVQNSAVDLWSQYRFLDSCVFGANFYAFRSRYAIMGGFENKKITGYRRMDELVKKEYSIAYRVTKAEALDLPEQMFETRYLELSPKEARLYETLRRQSIVELERAQTVTASTVLTKLLRLQQLTGGFLCADGETSVTPSGHGKLDAVADILEDYVLEAGHKLVIFARFLPELDALEKLLGEKKIGYVRLDGGVPMSARGELVRRFQQDSDVRVFLGQIDTVGLGVTLTAADTAVYYSYNFNYASYAQSLSRIHRIGQKNCCTYLHLAMRGTVDEAILQALADKEDLAKSVVDNWKKYF